MTSHDLHDEGALMGVGRWPDGIHCLNDSVESRVRSDGHVGAAKIYILMCIFFLHIV